MRSVFCSSFIASVVLATLGSSARAQELQPLRNNQGIVQHLARVGQSEPLPVARRFRAIRIMVHGTDGLQFIDVELDPSLKIELENLAIDRTRARLQELGVSDVEVLSARSPDPAGLQPCEIVNATFKLTFTTDDTSAGEVGLGATSVEFSRIAVKRTTAASTDCADPIQGGELPKYTWIDDPYLFAVTVGEQGEAIAAVRQSIQALIDYAVLAKVVAANHAAQRTLNNWIGKE